MVSGGEMSDLRERLANLVVYYGDEVDGSGPNEEWKLSGELLPIATERLARFIEAELAQATADALEAAAQTADKHDASHEGGLAGSDCNGDYCVSHIAKEIRSLIPDIAAKAKEHDTKISRAYLRCAEYLSVGGPWPIDTFRKWANEADGGGK
jgi:hypothetical protein